MASFGYYPASILYITIAGRYWPVSYPDGPIMARYRFIKNAYWVSGIASMCGIAFIGFGAKHK